eukprot:g68358.t1
MQPTAVLSNQSVYRVLHAPSPSPLFRSSMVTIEREPGDTTDHLPNKPSNAESGSVWEDQTVARGLLLSRTICNLSTSNQCVFINIVLRLISFAPRTTTHFPFWRLFRLKSAWERPRCNTSKSFQAPVKPLAVTGWLVFA